MHNKLNITIKEAVVESFSLKKAKVPGNKIPKWEQDLMKRKKALSIEHIETSCWKTLLGIKKDISEIEVKLKTSYDEVRNKREEKCIPKLEDPRGIHLGEYQNLEPGVQKGYIHPVMDLTLALWPDYPVMDLFSVLHLVQPVFVFMNGVQLIFRQRGYDWKISGQTKAERAKTWVDHPWPQTRHFGILRIFEKTSETFVYKDRLNILHAS